MNKIRFVILAGIFLALLAAQASAIRVSAIQETSFRPGAEGAIEIELENNLDEPVDGVSFSLNLAGTQFISVGPSEESINEIDEDKEEQITFRLKPAYDIKPGDYQIPYSLKYTYRSREIAKTGTIGIKVGGEPELSFTLEKETPVIGMRGRLTLRIVNNGLADARFVSVKINPRGYSLLSDNEVYVGTVDSDDFETATFDVVYDREKGRFDAIVEYRNLDNEKVTKEASIPFNAYTKEEAIKLGIIKKNNWPIYIGIIVVIIAVWLIWRAIQKRKRMKKSLEN